MNLSRPFIRALGRCCSGTAGTAALLLCLATSPAQGATNSPVGTWDCFVSGSQGVGLANITFNSDFTFDAVELLTIKPPAPSLPVPTPPTDGRPGSVSVTRGDLPPPPVASTNTPTSSTNLFGFGEVSGPWSFDRFGRVIGYFVERIEVPNSTNVVINSIGFVATVVPGRKLTLVASTPNGKVTYNGVPLSTNLTDLSGSWYATRRQGSSSLVEFFQATPLRPPSLFNIEGQGAGYTYSGVAMVSAWKRFGMAVEITHEDGTNNVSRSVIGPFYPKRGLATTAGIEEPKTRIRFNAVRN